MGLAVTPESLYLLHYGWPLNCNFYVFADRLAQRTAPDNLQTNLPKEPPSDTLRTELPKEPPPDTLLTGLSKEPSL